MSIEVRHVCKNYGGTPVLKDVSLCVSTGELVALLGPSGCGKTTLLRIIAGLEAPDSGEVLCNGEAIAEGAPEGRRMGFVFQHYALFRHMTVFENIAFGLRARPRRTRPSEAEIRRRVHALLEIIQLDWIAKRYPDQLSGGQRQRVALARVLAVEPRVLLLDEPFGSLDTKVRIELRRWLRERHADLGVTTLFVTHDQDEALEVSDRVVVIDAGHVEQVGTPDEVYHHPQTPFVCRFLGAVNVLSGGGDAAAPWYVRPHEIDLTREPGALRQPVTVREIHTAGPLVRMTVALAGRLIEVAIAHPVVEKLDPRIGEVLYAEPRIKRMYDGQPKGSA